MLCYCHYSTPHNYNQSTLYSIDGSVCRWNTIFVNTFSPQTQFQWPSTWFFFARLLAIIFRLAQICASYSVIHFRFEMWFVLLHHHFMHLLAVGYSLSFSQPRRRHRHPILIRDDSELIHSFDLCPELSSLTLTFLFSLFLSLHSLSWSSVVGVEWRFFSHFTHSVLGRKNWNELRNGDNVKLTMKWEN